MPQREIIASRLRLLPIALKTFREGFRGEITYDYDSKTLRLYDGQQRGGFELLRADLSNLGGTTTSVTLGTVTAAISLVGNLDVRSGEAVEFKNSSNQNAGSLRFDGTDFVLHSTANSNSIKVQNSSNTSFLQITESGSIAITADQRVTVESIYFQNNQIGSSDSTEIEINSTLQFNFDQTNKGDILAFFNNTSEIGSSTNRFNKIWIGTGGVDIGSSILTRSSAGKIQSSTGFESAVDVDISADLNIRQAGYNGTSNAAEVSIKTSDANFTKGSGQLIFESTNALDTDRKYVLIPAVNNQYALGNPSYRWKAGYISEMIFNDGTTQITSPENNPLVSTRVFTNRRATAYAIALGG
jgi:hypothetical protein